MNKIIYILLLFVAVNATGQDITIDSQANLQIYKNDTCITDKVPPQRIYAAQHGARLNEMVVLTKNVYDSLNERINNIVGGDVTLPQLNDSMSDIRDLIGANYTYFDTTKINYSDTALLIPTTYQLDTAKAAIRSEIPDLNDYATQAALDDTASDIRAAIPSSLGFVPYTGATASVDLGSHSITAERVNADTLEPTSSAGLHLHNTSHQDIFIAGAGGGQNLTVYAQTIFTNLANQNETDTVIGASSTGLLKKIGIATTYLKKEDTAALSNRIDAVQSALEDTASAIRGAGYITSSYLMRTFTTTNVTTTVDMDADTYNNYRITAQAGNLELEISASSPFHGQILTLDINSDGTGHTITYDASINNTGDAPTALSATSTTTTTWVFRYNGSGDWDYINSFEIEH